MKLNKLTPRQALIYDALIPPGMPVRGKDLARRTRISERDLRSERKAMQEQGVPIVTGGLLGACNMYRWTIETTTPTAGTYERRPTSSKGTRASTPRPSPGCATAAAVTLWCRSRNIRSSIVITGAMNPEHPKATMWLRTHLITGKTK